MITRLLTLIVIVTLALPIASLTPSGDPDQESWSEVALAAKGKHKKNATKHGKPSDTTPVTAPQFTTVTRPVRGTVTRTFTSADTNAGVILIPRGAPGITVGAANSYPGAITVNGLANGVITDVNLILDDFTHQHPGDVDFLLSSGDGRHALVVSDVGDSDNVTNIDLTLDDEATASLPETRLAGGVFKPTNINPTTYQDSDAFAAPAPNSRRERDPECVRWR